MAIVESGALYEAIRGSSGRLMGVDVGSQTLGLAVSDRSFMLASPLLTLKRTTWVQDVPRFQKIIQDNAVIALVVGLPLNMSGSEGERCMMVRKWVDKLLTFFDIPVCFWDERLTTAAAQDMMLDADLSRKRRKELVDKIAASYILSSFMERYSRTL